MLLVSLSYESLLDIKKKYLEEEPGKNHAVKIISYACFSGMFLKLPLDYDLNH